MQKHVLSLVVEVIERADRAHAADAVLRLALKARRGFGAEDSRAASHAVAAFYRWREWLDERAGLADRIHHAGELDERFRKQPASFTDAEMIARAVPSWTPQVMTVTADWARTLQTEPRLWLRARLGRGEELAARLGHSHPSAAAPLAEAVEYVGREDLFRTEAFHRGEFEIQDIASQAVGALCDPWPGETWWDACAGEGGKTLHLSDLMRNKGLIWASDRAGWRLERLRRRAARAGAFNYRAALWDGGPKPPTKTKFDGVLLDAPCSGLGTWQRNPHARWTTTPEDARELSEVQRRLLRHIAPSVKPGGKLIYSVCTLADAETTQVVREFESEFPDFAPVPLRDPFVKSAEPSHPLWLWPQATGGNGMFIAAWRR